jgi:4-hydroxy-tetrahydrodipicolinate synthase
MQREQCGGVWAPIVTPFAADGLLDVHAVPAIVDWLVSRRVRGLLALGTTGEAAHCTDREAVSLVEAVVSAAAGRVPVVAGSGRASTAATIEMSRRFADAGAEAVFVLTPHADRMRMDHAAFTAHYAAVASACPVPVFAYHMPGATGVDLLPDTLLEIVGHENIWGFKDSSVEGGPLADVLSRTRTVGFVGAGSRVIEALEAGAAGAILAAVNAIPETCIALETAWRRGDRDRAAELQAAVTRLTSAWKGWAISGVKHALARRGVRVGLPRAPLRAAPADVLAQIDTALAAALAASG